MALLENLSRGFASRQTDLNILLFTNVFVSSFWETDALLCSDDAAQPERRDGFHLEETVASLPLLL